MSWPGLQGRRKQVNLVCNNNKHDGREVRTVYVDGGKGGTRLAHKYSEVHIKIPCL